MKGRPNMRFRDHNPSAVVNNAGFRQLHIRRNRAVMSMGSLGAFVVRLVARAFGQLQISKRSRTESGIKRVREVYMCRSPLPFC